MKKLNVESIDYPENYEERWANVVTVSPDGETKLWPNYFVSDWGRVYNAKTDTLLKPLINTCGYIQVQLYPSSEYSEPYLVHRLVAWSFLKNPKNKPEVNHIDRDRTNNNIENLEWCTHAENMAHSAKMRKEEKTDEH